MTYIVPTFLFRRGCAPSPEGARWVQRQLGKMVVAVAIPLVILLLYMKFVDEPRRIQRMHQELVLYGNEATVVGFQRINVSSDEKSPRYESYAVVRYPSGQRKTIALESHPVLIGETWSLKVDPKNIRITFDTLLKKAPPP